MSGKLILVGTPIGNLEDLSPRGIEALQSCDFIAAEDTRVTLKLLNRFGIKKPMVSYFEHNRRERGEIIVSRILAGENCVLVTDAGMPAISDPGEDLVALCHASGITVTAAPGPAAFVTALALSGMPAGRFTFEGFLSVNKKSRREHLESILTERRTMIFYEAPHKLPNTLADMAQALGDRRIALVREITKIHEEVILTTLFEAREKYRDGGAKGEFVLIVEGAPAPEKESYTLEEAAEMAAAKVGAGASAAAAAKETAKLTGLKKGDIYRELLQTAGEEENV